MKNIILILLLSVFMATVNVMADTNGEARTSSNEPEITAVNRMADGITHLIIQRNQNDILTIPNTPRGIIPKLQASCLFGDKLALVIDFGLSFHYQLYHLQSGMWVLKSEVVFSEMNTRKRLRIELVDMPALDKVVITYNKGGADSLRKKGVVHKDDPQDVFVFSDQGTSKNGSPYMYGNSE